jgi:hypothetical protein
MSITGKIISRDGRLLVLHVSNNWSEPTTTYQYWPVETTYGTSIAKPSEGDAVTYIAGRGVWTAYDPSNNRATGTLRVSEGKGFVEKVSNPCPKVRGNVETRYHNGVWEKLLKKGWVPA